MLLGLDPLLTADLLHALAAMGHGDQIVLVDANYPSRRGKRTIEVAGADVIETLAAILSVLPVDTYVAHPAMVMEVVGDPDSIPEVVTLINENLRNSGWPDAVGIERHAFYAAAETAYAIVRTGERRFYGNVLLTKGVIPPPVG
ncbi:MAG TPA: RbsD/FucU domain-containing protein [Acetobacteraceae bacterium]|jgi:L-fucose mutarotase|nr:RbsD/FucU domain-containing protein [Acetobacteraceae bacterium]